MDQEFYSLGMNAFKSRHGSANPSPLRRVDRNEDHEFHDSGRGSGGVDQSCRRIGSVEPEVGAASGLSKVKEASMKKVALTSVFLSTVFLAPMAAQALKTGPEVGSRIPDFEARDQEGQVRTFENLTGRAGLLLLFYRTADW